MIFILIPVTCIMSAGNVVIVGIRSWRLPSVGRFARNTGGIMETKCTLNDDDLILKCEAWIDKLCKTGAKAWSLRVPVDYNNDPDMLFDELIKRFKDKK